MEAAETPDVALVVVVFVPPFPPPLPAPLPPLPPPPLSVLPRMSGSPPALTGKGLAGGSGAIEAGGREEEEEMSEEVSLSSVVDFKAKGNRERNNFFTVWFTTRRPERNGKVRSGCVGRRQNRLKWWF